MPLFKRESLLMNLAKKKPFFAIIKGRRVFLFCFGLWGFLVDYSRFPNIQSKTECMLEHGGFLARGREKEACGSGSFHLASLSHSTVISIYPKDKITPTHSAVWTPQLSQNRSISNQKQTQSAHLKALHTSVMTSMPVSHDDASVYSTISIL